ncbi:ABC transporter ATP-binding protein [Antarcticimicrobium luteum]|uniref:Spermidine/putrescine import ATP-binding protein PotA n=1 Tax=Antarcticimicrobium luteum TaxID=2547397 RepID=A0A4V3ASP6_9RHOB|nr:ABC transporter ATP-binding protein [Antarcticimicrobium luteum]TDK51461.1 ABC transporter ATP-binding protein [Antarcticimicrobium luteum]
MKQSDAYISIRNVNKLFGSFQAISDVSIDIRQGEFFSLLGSSGCGKTTLLRMLAGFEMPTSGEIFIDGQPMSEVPPHRRPVNMVFQSYAIFPHLNVRDNIAYGLRKRKLSRAKRDTMVDEMLELIKLPEYGDRKANQLSGGQRQRIALARALILRPKVLLLDEPLGALDKQLREQMQLELRALQKTVGITFVFVTHDQEEALTLSDRIAVMANGRELQVDTPTRLYERPVNRDVASFIGNMNFFEGKITGISDHRASVDVKGLGHVTTTNFDAKLKPGVDICIAIRPEKLILTENEPRNTGNKARGQMDKAAYLGERSHYYVRLDGISQPVAISAQNRQRAEGAPEEKRPIWISWEDDAFVVLEDG